MNGDESPIDLLSLPRGGGALTGLGETFEPDIQMGTGNLSVPIALPTTAGRSAPQLALTYSTGKGNGPFGLGWDVALPGVARRTSLGVPTYDDTRDTFLLGGHEELVEIPGTEVDTVSYRPAAEGLFARIGHRTGTEDCWEVRSPDGSRARYGTRVADIPAGEPDPATVSSPRGATFAWRVTLGEDAFQNRVEYRYLRDPSTPANAPGAGSLYLSEVTYGDYGVPPAVGFLVRVRFVYEDRPDSFVDHAPGFALPMTQRCIRIEIVSGPGAVAPMRVYHLRYADQLDPARVAANGASLLSQIQAEGRDGTATQPLPPLDLGYTRFAPDRRDLVPVRGEGLPMESFGAARYAFADTSADGLPDLVSVDHGIRIWRNEGEARFALPRDLREAPVGVSLADGSARLLDADGDGRIDVVVTDPLPGYFPLRFDERWDPRSLRRYESPPTFSMNDPLVRLVDLDGDGVTDAVRSGDRLECFFADRDGRWRKERALPRRALAEFPDVSFDDRRVRFADMTGDGSRAIVLIHPGRVDYWPRIGRGDWGARVTMRNSPRLPQDWDPARLLLGDVDGDGTADLLYVEPGRVLVHLNQGGRSWGEPIEISGTPPVHSGVSVQLMDLLGSGVAGVLWSSDRSNGRDTTFFLDLTGGTKPYLMDRIDNHIGAVTRIEYQPSTVHRIQDSVAGRPWRTPLPVPVQVVARVESLDRLSGGKLTSEYSYHHGYWDGVAREFRGFGCVDRRDTQAFADYVGRGLDDTDGPTVALSQGSFSPPLETRTWFHLGDTFGPDAPAAELGYEREFWAGDPPALDRPQAVTDLLDDLPNAARRRALRTLRGRIVRIETYGRDDDDRSNRPYQVTEYLHGVLPLPIGSPLDDPASDWQLRSFFPCELARRTTTWERGNDPMTQLRFIGDFDVYGRARSQLDVAVPRGRDYRYALDDQEPHQPYIATRTVTAYADRDDALFYRVDRVASVTTTDVDLAPYEAASGESPSAAGVEAAVAAGLVDAAVIAQTVDFYDGDAFEGLGFGEIGDHGALTRRERLVLTEELLTRAYGEADGSPWRPSYVVAGATPGAEYPAAFLGAAGFLAGYVERSAAPHEPGLFAVVERRAYDFHDAALEPRGLVTAMRDPLGRDTTIEYDAYRHIPLRIVDAAGLTTQATGDYRLLRPAAITDPNGNRTRLTFTPWGMLESIARSGKQTEGVGDPDTEPGTTFAYDFRAFDERDEPISVSTTRRIHAATDTSVSEPVRSETIEQRVYSDGFGRILQTRALATGEVFGDASRGDSGLAADPTATIGPAVATGSTAPRVLISAWQTYDNKSRVVERYEPTLGTGWAYVRPAAAGARTRFVHDATGSTIRTQHPDGSEQVLVKGVPGTIAAPSLGDPTDYEPTPWERYFYDANDSVGRTHPVDPRAPRLAAHADTPSSVVRDALGRAVETVERLRVRLAGGALSSIEEVTTKFSLDPLGRVIEARDPLERVAARNVYALDGALLRTERLDGGLRRIVRDATGAILESRDERGTMVLHAHDALHRPVLRWARDEAGGPVTLRERLEYGDGGTATQPAAARQAQQSHNRLGRLHEHYDEAGLLTMERYDHRGNALETTRKVIRDERFVDVFDTAIAWAVNAFTTDWTVASASTLEDRRLELLSDLAYTTTTRFDALDRPVTVTAPARDGAAGTRSVTRFEYDPGGLVTRVELDGRALVTRAAYDARGGPILVAHPPTNGMPGLMRRAVNDPLTGRVVRQRSERYTDPVGDGRTFQPSAPAAAVQDSLYEYDLIGTVLATTDRAPTPPVTRTFAYDSLSRLVEESGRECGASPAEPWFDAGLCPAGGASRQYGERIAFDPAGNVTGMWHDAGGVTVSKVFTLETGRNRVAGVTIGAATYAYEHDAAGNLTRETTSRHFAWDHQNRLRVFRNQTRAAGAAPDADEWAEPSVHAQYLYDAGGSRVLKIVRRQGGRFDFTVSIGAGFEHRRWTDGGAARSASSVDLALAGERIAVDRRGDTRTGEAGPGTQFYLTDRVGSSVVLLDESYGELDRESYSAFGRTTLGGTVRKRARYSGKERDEESGLGYFGARYYAPWLARWTSRDPSPLTGDLNPYAYARNDPASRRDRDGRQSRRESVTNLAMASTYAATGSAAEPDEDWALPYFPRTTPVRQDEPEEPGEKRSLLGALFEFLTRDRDKPPATPTPPPPPPPAIAGDIYSDDGTAWPIDLGERVDVWPQIYRRVQTGPEIWSIESSADQGGTWKATGRTVWSPASTKDIVITPEQQVEREMEKRADATRAAQIGGFIAGALLGALHFAVIALIFSAIGVSSSSLSRMWPWGLLASVAMGSLILGLTVQPDERERPDPNDYPTVRIMGGPAPVAE